MFEFKAVPSEFKANSAKREVTGYASIFGNVDRVGDIVLPGAFAKTLREDLPAGRIEVKRNHKRKVGHPVHAEEDTKGLLTVSKIDRTPIGDRTLAQIEDGEIDAMSIGYVAEQKGYLSRGGERIRQIKAARLSEWSLLDIEPANPLAIITEVKAANIDVMAECLDRILERLQALEESLGPGHSDVERNQAEALQKLLATLRGSEESEVEILNSLIRTMRSTLGKVA